MKNVFVSSTFTDLEEYREEIIKSIRRLSLIDISMENFGSRDNRPLEECQKLIAAADLFVGVYAHRYGFTPPSSTQSITELEYATAVENEVPRFLYVIDENHPWPPSQIDKDRKSIENFKQKICLERMIGKFTNKDQLASSISSDLGRYLLESSFSSTKKIEGKVLIKDPKNIDEWINYRNQIYDDFNRFFLVHTLWPSKESGQEYDIFIYIIPHKDSIISEILKAEFFFGKFWENKIFTVEISNNQIGINTSAYGPFLAICKIYMKDGSTKVLNRYIDFEQGELFYANKK